MILGSSTAARWVGAGALAGATALHAGWTVQTVTETLPDNFAEVWIGEGARTPPAWMTAGVAVVLGSMSLVVAKRHRTAWAVAAVLGLRAVGGFIASGLSTSDGPYRTRDLLFYSPFCAAVALAIMHSQGEGGVGGDRG